MSFRHALACTVLNFLLISSLSGADGPATKPSTAASTTTTASPTTEPSTATPTINSSAPAVKSYSVDGHGDLNLTIPAGWNESEDAPQPGMPRTVRLTDPDEKFEILISILPPPKDVPDFNSPQKLRAIADAQGTHMLATSRETSVALEEIKGASANGFVYTLTDRTPAPGSFEFITGGVVGVGDLILSTTMLMHEKNPPQRATALAVLSGASQSSGAPASTQATPQQKLAVSLPDRSWQIAIDSPGLKILEDEMSPDQHARHLSAIDPASGVNVSIFLEPAATIGDARTTRLFFFERLKRSPLLIREDKFIEAGDAARVDYVLPDTNQRHANVYFSKEAVWVDVHISVEDLKGEKQSLIDEIARSVKLEPRERESRR
ncbi:hypothetical protein BH09PLA1_BH09PLA1_37670 [soil metagenome]